MVQFPFLHCIHTFFLLFLSLSSIASFRCRGFRVSGRRPVAVIWSSRFDVEGGSLPSSKIDSVATDTDTNPTTTPRTRRIRYTGKYPKAFGEKYKELNQNVTVMQHVISKGTTPAGSHVSIMVDEILELVPTEMKFAEKTKRVKLGGIVSRKRGEIAAAATQQQSPSTFVSVDCTLGFGGHSLAILNKLTEHYGKAEVDYHHVMLDRDAIEMDKTKSRLIQHTTSGSIDGQKHLSFHHANFGDLASVLTCLPPHVQSAGAGDIPS